ncbi:MAG: tRNA pseudouridine(55) synthase TruB [Candidatus Odinarchaeota archaeon]
MKLLETVPVGLLEVFEHFLQELNMSLQDYQPSNLRIFRKETATELYYLDGMQSKILESLDNCNLGFVFGGLQLGWFSAGKTKKKWFFHPTLAFIDSLPPEKQPSIHLQPKIGQSFLHGQNVRTGNFDNPETDKDYFLVYTEGILIGLGKIEKTGELINITDKGKYIRSERKRYGIKSGKETRKG